MQIRSAPKRGSTRSVKILLNMSDQSSSSDTAMGPLSSTGAADRLEAQVKEAIDAGATLVAGGGREGNFFKTAVITDIAKDNPAYSEEFFGPDYKILRGGSWATRPGAIRNTFRNWDYPIRRQIFSGFRCAQDV